MSNKISEGIAVTGFWQLRVEPDYAQLAFAVSRAATEPTEAFEEVRATAARVRKALEGARVAARDVQVSRIGLQEEKEFKANTWIKVGFRARVGFGVRCDRLDEVEGLLVSLVAAGVNELTGTTFSTTRMRELRQEARGHAVEMARAKAETFAKAAGVKLGRVLEVMDGNLARAEPSMERSHYVAPPRDEDESSDRGALAPGMMTVSATVTMRFAIDGT